ncbi:sugar transferase [Halobaculum sp. MBLA0147]|uniref:sugar transferase n=1 Tax=Halobaculum sp. MBLA0147 TaxID=3079934 RepID=UPI0035257B11
MSSQRWYRLVTLLGTLVVTAVIVVTARSTPVQQLATNIPVLSTLPVRPHSQSELFVETAIAVAVVGVVFTPLYKPQPRRILDTASLAAYRTVFAITILATVGYFDYTYRLPRLTLIVAALMLLVTLPTLLMLVRRRPRETTRAVVIGDDPNLIQTVIGVADFTVVGYVAPPTVRQKLSTRWDREQLDAITDGGTIGGKGCIGGIAQFPEVLTEYDIDTAVLAFKQSDRKEFFGTIEVCHQHGIDAMVHEAHADTLLTDEMERGPLVSVVVEPWDWQDRLVKRGFDIAFSTVALTVLSPLLVVIALAIKLEDGGTILYRQERTANFGDVFTIYKFRSMIENAEAETGAKLSEGDTGSCDPRVTRVGRVLRRTHLDEAPQLWSILIGNMSVVGPRPERPALDADIQDGVKDWHKRWFVKPGLTGLAQINDATGHEPADKLRYDVKYVKTQSFETDIKIVLRQVFQVLVDLWEILR